VRNPWCEVLSIDEPRLEAVKDHREANSYSLLIVALLERGGPMTLSEVAERFAEAGVASHERALQSLTRCKPAREPVFRDGHRYALDPHSDELDLWAFRLGLRPPRASAPPRRVPEPVPGPDVPLSIAELEEAWKEAPLESWSRQRLALAVLEAHGRAMRPDEVVGFVTSLTGAHRLRTDPTSFRQAGSAIRVLDDGCWAIGPGAAALASARAAIRARLKTARTYARPAPAEIQRSIEEGRRRRAAHAAQLARLHRGLIAAFPPERPEAASIIDINGHSIESFVGDEMAELRSRLEGFDVIGAVEVRALLRALGIEPGARRLAELGPPQKTRRLNKRGRTLKITTALLIQGSCGISRPLGDPAKLAAYLADGQHGKLRRRLEADAKALHALYQYGRLHGGVRLRWGFLDEMLPAPWVHTDEPTLGHLMEAACQSGAPLEIVLGSAPGWTDPWSRARIAHAHRHARYHTWLEDEDGYVVARADVQLARLAAPVH
jgi:hypothetical protein